MRPLWQATTADNPSTLCEDEQTQSTQFGSAYFLSCQEETSRHYLISILQKGDRVQVHPHLQSDTALDRILLNPRIAKPLAALNGSKSLNSLCVLSAMILPNHYLQLGVITHNNRLTKSSAHRQ